MAAPEQQIGLIETWLEHLMAQGRSPHTLKAYRRSWHHLARWYQGTYGESCDPTRLIARDIRDWKSYQQSVEKAAPNTINQRLVAVSSFYKWALAHDQVSRDPTADINTIRVAPQQPKSLSTKQLRRLLRAVHNGGSARDVAIIEILVGTGHEAQLAQNLRSTLHKCNARHKLEPLSSLTTTSLMRDSRESDPQPV